MDIKFNGAYQRAHSGQIYDFEAVYRVLGVRVSWSAKVRQSSELRGSPHGTIDIPQDTRVHAMRAVEAGVKSWIEGFAE